MLDYFLKVDVGSDDKRKLCVTYFDNFYEVSFDRNEKGMTHVNSKPKGRGGRSQMMMFGE